MMDIFGEYEEMEHTNTDIDCDLIEDEDGINIMLSGLDNDHEEIIRFSKS